MFNQAFKSSLNALEAIETSKKIAEIELPAIHYERKKIYQALLEETSKGEEADSAKIYILMDQLRALVPEKGEAHLGQP